MNHRTIYGRNSGHKLICLLVLLFRGNVLGQETPRQEARSEDLKLGLTTVKPQVQLAEGDIGDLKSSSSSQSLARVNRATKKPPQTLDHERDELAAPSVTSVHQVWASSSSGSLEELSPEIISKLGGSVPFLAAYALRPRLVGVSALPAHRTQPGNSIQPMESLTNARVLAPMDDASGNQAASSSPDESEGSIVSKLGEFNELKVETSSTSKSEHRHDRKTTLKRNNRELELTKRRVIKEADQLKKRRVKPLARPSLAESGKQRGRKSISGSRSANKGRVVGGTGSHGSQARAGRLRAKTERKGRLHPLNAVKRGRQVQEQSNGTVVAADLDENSVESEESGRGATEVDGLKGGNGRKRKHFYSAVEKSSNPSDEQDGDEQAKGNAGRDSSTVSDSGDEGSDIQRDPKRVGDEDVDEEGDTVTVMPKSDGVDDDPDLGEGGEEGGPVEEREFGERESEEQPREADKEGSEADMEKQDERDENSLDQGRGDGKAAGGGLGATIGDGTPTMRGTGATNNADEEDGRMGGNKSEKSAPEDKARDRDEGNEREESIGQTESSGKRDESSRRNKHNEDDDDDSRFGSDARGRSADKEDTERNKGTGLDAQGFGGKQEPMGFRKSVGSNADKNGEEEEPDDVDYRDELEASARKKHTGRENSSPKKHSRDEADCEDRAHDYDHDGHHDHGHHSHHDSIKWLEDAIPGQPNEDYPILSRTNLTSFNCRKQKYAGYYADVEARCQVFHICQADGRQDSFICPNGTIFNQITSVCAWWNSFDCEDAPKYYDLNALLYKTAPSVGRIFPASRADLEPSSGDASKAHGLDGDREESSFEGLIRAMRRAHESRGSSRDGNQPVLMQADRGAKRSSTSGGSALGGMTDTDIGADNEATVQRKSTNNLDASEDESASLGRASSRLIANAAPRRERRASVRQAPPKLKSRRVSRNSRRRKLRHGIKPKRRA